MAMRKLKKYVPTKFKAKKSVYDKDAADYAVNFIQALCHTKGTWAGKPFELIDWQEQIIRDLFGTLKPTGYRQFNTAYVEIPKKMGKSELAAAVALLLTCGDGEERAEVYGCAADRQQATIVFDVAADMVRMCPALNKRVKILASQKRIIFTPTNSFYQVLSTEAYSKHGFNIHGVVFDELHKPAQECTLGFQTGILALLQTSGYSNALERTIERTDNRECKKSCIREKKTLENNRRTARLYDILNAGPHHRFTVSGHLVHNCGYGGGTGALKAMGALDMGLKEEELQPLVTAWRNSNPNIVKFWWAVDRAVMKAIIDRTTTETHGLTFTCRSGMLFITLPSGRKLAYVKPRIGMNQFGGESVTYEGIGATKKWERIESYGPKFVENIVQAIARDILCYAMKTLRHCSIVMHIHDELVIEANPRMSLDAVCEQMGRTPPWADGLILDAAGYITPFYKKD